MQNHCIEMELAKYRVRDKSKSSFHYLLYRDNKTGLMLVRPEKGLHFYIVPVKLKRDKKTKIAVWVRIKNKKKKKASNQEVALFAEKLKLIASS